MDFPGPLKVACVFLAIAACSEYGAAQSTLGSITGVVKDPSGAGVAGATLTLKNLSEGTMSSVASSSEGLYEFLNLKSGRYTVTAAKDGFTPEATPEILLDARQTQEADLTLPVAGSTQTVTVTAQVPLVDTEDGTISDSKNFEQITRLPLNYRASALNSPLLAILTVPGVNPAGPVQLSLGGGLPAQVEVSIDGISVVNLSGVGGNSPNYGMTPSPEIIGEFKVTSVDNSAEFGQMGDISMVTRGGTNQLHGSAFWYLQNRALNANIYGSPAKPAKVYNTFGGRLSGPVELPFLYHGRNRTFFFVDYEGNHLPTSRLDQLLVPAAPMRTGNLDGVPGPAAVDPLSGQPFPDNQIPLTRINSVATALLGYYPLPNTPLHSNINYLHLSDTSTETNGYDARIDHVINSKQHLYARLTEKWSNLTGDLDPLPPDSADAGYYNFVVSHAYAPSATLSNEARFGFTRTTYVAHFPLLATDVVSKLDLTGLDLANVAGLGEFPAFTFNGGNGSSFSYVIAPRPANTNSRIFQFADVLSWVHGRHTMKFGGEVRHVGYHANQNGDDLGEFDFEDAAFSGNAFADLLLGLPASSYYEALGPDADESAVDAGFFAQDNWKVHRRFTLQYGLRWEVHSPFVDAHGNIASFDHQTGNVIVPDNSLPPSPTFLSAINACSIAQVQLCTKVLKASQVGLPNSLRHTYYGDWDPRLGFAWQPWADGKTVIRGGIGRYTQSLLGGFAYAPTGIATSDERTYRNYTSPGVPPLFMFPNVSPPLSNLGSPSGLESFGPGGVDPNFRDPYSFQWNFTIERELPWSTVFRASYVGVQSVGMPVIVDYNQVPASAIPWSQARTPFPLWANLYSMEPIGFSNYQGMQLEASHRFHNDLFFQASYVLSKNLGEVGAPNPAWLFPPEYSGGARNAITDRFDTRYDRGNFPGARRNQFLLTGLFPLPFGKGREFGSDWRGFKQGALGGWELSTVTLIESGPYLTPIINSSFDQSNTGLVPPSARPVPARPDRIGNGDLPNTVNGRIWNPSAFVPVPAGAGRFGNAGAGILEGPGAVVIAGGLAKTFLLTEKLRLRIEATFTNLPNHPNFAPPVANVSSQAFGALTTVQSAQNSGNRTGQLAARFDF